MRGWLVVIVSWTGLAAGCWQGGSDATDGPLARAYAADHAAAPLPLNDAAPERAARLTAQEALAAVQGFAANSDFCHLVGTPPGTCSVGLSALIRCNDAGYWLRHGFPAPDPVPARYRTEWDAEHSRWLIEVTCRDNRLYAAVTAKASFWYYERHALVAVDDSARRLFTGIATSTTP